MPRAANEQSEWSERAERMTNARRSVRRPPREGRDET